MAYTYEQLTKAYTAVHGVEPTSEAASQLRLLTNVSYTDTQRLAYILNSADQSTSVAVLSYQFFTGKAPSAEGMDYLLKSGATNLNSETYAKFNLENRFMNFATNLALQGEGKAAFEASYGSMTYAQYVASIYESIIGKAQATAAGLNPEQTILDIIGRQDLILQSARNNGVIGPNATAAEIDLALKAATAAYLLAEGIKADVGVYAGATNNFMVGLATGKANYNTDILTTHAPTAGSDSSGVGNTIDNPPAFEDLPGAPQPEPEPQGPTNQTFTLTTGDDKFTGGAGNDTFNATDLTFSNSNHDILDGGAGADTLHIVATGNYSMPNNGVSNIETVTIEGSGTVSANAYQFTGLTALNVTSVGQASATAKDDVTVNVTVTQQAMGGISVYGGKDVTVDATSATIGAITVGDTGNRPTGDIVIGREMTGAFTGGAITVNGGKTVSVTQTAVDPLSGVQQNGQVNVAGSALTTEVTIKSAQTFNNGGASRAANSVTIYDVNYSSNSLAGTISKVAVDSYTSLTINGNGLTDLSLAHGSGNVILRKGALVAPTNTELNLALNGLTGGALEDAGGQYQTLNVTTGAQASTLGGLTFANLETLDVKGASTLTVQGSPTLANLQTVKVGGAAGLNMDLSKSSVTLADTSTSTGVNTLKIDASQTLFTGGAGVDRITLSSSTIDKSITLGGGDDVLTVASGTTKVDAMVSGGSGIDTLIINVADAAALSLQGTVQFSDFEILQLNAVTAKQSIDLSVVALGIGGTVRTAGGDELTLNGSGNLGALELTGAGTSYFLNDSTWAGGTNDSLTLTLNNSDAANRDFASDGISASSIETIAIVSNDVVNAGSVINSVTLNGGDLRTVTVSGNASLHLTATSDMMTTLDASGITDGGFEWKAGSLMTKLALTGSATGTNTIDLTDVFTGFTYVGGSGSDNITVSGGKNTIDLGTGADHVTLTWAPSWQADFAEITGFDVDDKLTLAITGGPAAPTSLNHLQGHNTVQEYVTAATAGGVSTVLQWFTVDGDTYLIQDRHVNATYANGVDIMVKLVGVNGLSGNWAVNGGTLEYGLI